MISSTAYRSTLIASVVAALGATACCVVPLAFVTLGLGGAWLATVRSLEPAQPLFAAVAIGSLGFAFHSLYVQPRRCEPGDACLSPTVLKRQRIIFWVVAANIAALGLFYACLVL